MIAPVTTVGNPSSVARTPSSVLCRPVPSMSTPMPRSSGQVAAMARVGSIAAREDAAAAGTSFDELSATTLSPHCRSTGGGRRQADSIGYSAVPRARRRRSHRQPVPATIESRCLPADSSRGDLHADMRRASGEAPGRFRRRYRIRHSGGAYRGALSGTCPRRASGTSPRGTNRARDSWRTATRACPASPACASSSQGPG